MELSEKHFEQVFEELENLVFWFTRYFLWLLIDGSMMPEAFGREFHGPSGTLSESVPTCMLLGAKPKIKEDEYFCPPLYVRGKSSIPFVESRMKKECTNQFLTNFYDES